MFNKFYEDELLFLREMGREFARANPAAAPYLAEPGADPDVERLLQGFAFLTGQIRQKLDDELPELSQSLFEMMWPHYLRPVPSMSVVEFEPLLQLIREPKEIPRGTEIDSVPVEGVACRFRTCYGLRVLPIMLEDVRLEEPAGSRGRLTLSFRLSGGTRLDALRMKSIRIFLHGDASVTQNLFLHLTRRVGKVIARGLGASSPGAEVELPGGSVQPAGYSEEEALLPYPSRSFPGYRLIQEYFALPQKFHFLDITGIPPLEQIGAEDRFELVFEFSEALEGKLRVGKDNIRLNCTPVVNLFEAESDPLRIEHRKVEYLVRPAGMDISKTEIFSLNKVHGWLRGSSEEREYPPFFAFRERSELALSEGVIYYFTRLRQSILGKGVDTLISFVTQQQEKALPPTETVVCDLTCSNRHIAGSLRVGDINRGTGSSPEFAKFKNITAVTPSVPPPIGQGVHWRVISNLTLNHLSLASPEALRGVLDVYNFQALHSRQAAMQNDLRLSGIEKVTSLPEERLHLGALVRGTRIELDLKESNFAGEGGMLLFGEVLNVFLSLYCTINSFTHLVVRGTERGEVFDWTPRNGQQVLI